MVPNLSWVEFHSPRVNGVERQCDEELPQKTKSQSSVQ